MTPEQHTQEATRQLIRNAKMRALELLLSKGLYSSISTEGDIGEEIRARLRDGGIGTFDCYCVTCRQVTPFIITKKQMSAYGGGSRNQTANIGKSDVFSVSSVCQRDMNAYVYVLQEFPEEIVKIGQYPSLADISFGELREIDGSLDNLDRKELGTALGLFAHDAASGAFVYLRRVFERMIDRAHHRLAARATAIPDFDKKRMDEKIEALEAELPDRVVKNKGVFKVLSLGIHDLTDEECKTLFPVVKAVIFQMLEQEEHKRRREQAEAETDKALAALMSAGHSRV